MDRTSLVSSNLNGIYAEMSELIGMEATMVMFENYKGQQITYPTRFLSRKYVEAEIIRRYNGNNIKKLAKEFGYTERWTRNIAKKGKKE